LIRANIPPNVFKPGQTRFPFALLANTLTRKHREELGSMSGGYGYGYGFGIGLRRLLIFLLVIATIFVFAGVGFGGY
jgi:hypothetical protein